MLRAVPHNILSWDFTVYDGDTPVADLDMAWLREKGVLTIGDVSCRVYREGLMSGAFILEAEGHVLLRAVKPNAFFRTFEITCDDRHLTLEAQSAILRTFVLREGDRRLGTVAPEHALTRKATADLPEDLPLVVRVFILWLVLLLWKRAADAAASG